jgi:hypothetical protein
MPKRKKFMLYYRVAFQADSQTSRGSTWTWRSNLLSSPRALFTLLQSYSYLPKEHIRVFFASSDKVMNEMLNRQNRGQLSSSMGVDQLLLNNCINTEEVMRLEFEMSTKPDHDEPYIFTLPMQIAQLRRWIALMVQFQSQDDAPAQKAEISGQAQGLALPGR